jgi:hypothetical protein
VTDSPNDARTKVWSVPSIANIAAPTVAELNAGTSLECLITADGLIGFNPTTAEVDTSALCSDTDSKQPGRASFSGTMLRLKKQVPLPDTVYNTMIKNYVTNIVIRSDVAVGTAWTVGDKVRVYPVACGEVNDLQPEANSVHKYEVPTMITGAVNLRATVA